MRSQILILLFALSVVACEAKIIVVDDDGPADFNNIQAAINDSNDGDIVVVFPGTYTGPGNRDIDFGGRAITVRSVAPDDPYIVAATLIDCNGSETDPHRGFHFRRNEQTGSVLDGLTIKNAYSPWHWKSLGSIGSYKVADPGGGIYCEGGTYLEPGPGPTIRNCVITENASVVTSLSGACGAGIYGSSGPIINCTITRNLASYGAGLAVCTGPIINCTISDNTALSRGGGLSWCEGEIRDCNIIHNTATGDYYENGGGGIYSAGSEFKLINCTIRGNSTGGLGGGVLFTGLTGGRITGCTISENSAGSGGGVAVHEPCDSFTVTECTIRGNYARFDGGGLLRCYRVSNCLIAGNVAGDNGGGLTDCRWVTNSVIVGNTAGELAGGIYCYWFGSSITNCTISANTANYSSGGIGCYAGGWTIVTHGIVWGNADNSGTGEWAQIRGVPVVVTSCIQDDDPDDPYIPFGGHAYGNIDDNPMFVRDPNDGGDGWGDDPCTPGVDEGANDDFGDIHLRRGSPCINAGDPCFAENRRDIDGEPRVMGGRLDIGADEFLVPKLTVTSPTKEETWVSGTYHEIRWNTFEYDESVDILFSTDAGTNWGTIASSFAGAESYAWHLPEAVDSNRCLISVVPSVPDVNVVCVDSGLFTIHPDSPGPTVVSRWRSLGGDFDRAGLSETYGPELGCVKWEFETGGGIPSSVTIGFDGRVHVACEDGKLYTLDANGVLLWSYDANSPLISSPSIGPDGTVYVGSENGRLYAIAIDGNLQWTHTTDSFIYSSPAVSTDGNIYVGTGDGVLYALGPDGSELWSRQVGSSGVVQNSIFASPAIGADGTVYVAALRDPNLYALDPNDGRVKWACNFEFRVAGRDPYDYSTEFGWPFASPVIAADGTIYQTLLYDPNIYAIEPNTGTIRWSIDLTAPCYLYWDSCYSCYEEDWCWYKNACKGTHVEGWSEPALGPDGTIYVSVNDEHLRAIDPNGAVKWVKRLGKGDGFTLTVGSDGLVYAADDHGYLCVVDTDGSEIARFESRDWLIFPVISADNTIIVTDGNSVVRAIGRGACDDMLDLHRPEDLDGNGSTDFVDFTLLADDWLADTTVPLFWEGYICCRCEYDDKYLTGDIDRNLYVDFADLATLANRWLSED